ncbi:hypothetical protein J5N97_020698 [Dioscorea zingiberensis]|uniref:GIR1-like zinc ribbon domain-containing protein n=1 Tax=Dioscorea zingiberensis TaxID=325984 RepID=A0A9D5HDP2_9LILI|nr:hypothetical protein J5N97_020698 [Dioscorea zingiberensis]
MNGRSPKPEVNVSPARNNGGPSAVVNDDDDEKSTNRSSSTSPRSPPSSCVSSESDQGMKYSSSPEAAPMVLAGCPYCLLYVMVFEEDPKCPKCKRVVKDYLYDKNGDRKNKKN